MANIRLMERAAFVSAREGGREEKERDGRWVRAGVSRIERREGVVEEQREVIPTKGN